MSQSNNIATQKTIFTALMTSLKNKLGTLVTDNKTKTSPKPSGDSGTVTTLIIGSLEGSGDTTKFEGAYTAEVT